MEMAGVHGALNKETVMGKDKPQYEIAIVKQARTFAKTTTDLEWAKEKQFALDIVRKNKTLKLCLPDSIGNSMLQIASIGLSLNPTLGYCYLIPRRIQKNPDIWLAYPSPSYKGLVYLATVSGAVKWVVAEIVYKSDEFQYRGPAEKPHHVPNMAAKHEEKYAIGAYCIAKTADGDFLTSYMDRETVQRIRKMSEFPGGAMWHPDKLWTEGWKKAVIRRAWKLWPHVTKSTMDRAITVLNENEGISDVPVESFEGECVEYISDSTYADLISKIEEYNFDVERTLERLAVMMGVDDIKHLPKAKMPEMLEQMDEAIKQKQARQAS